MADISRLRPEFADFIADAARNPRRSPTASVEENRAAAEIDLSARWGAVEFVAEVRDLLVPGTPDVPVRLYRPTDARGTIVFIHGGGWVNGSVDLFDGPSRMLANRSGATVISVEYRRAPEHPFPAGLTDCDRVLEWVWNEAGRQGIDADRVVVAGESAGGNLAAVVARHARDRGMKLAGQILIYPVTDLTRSSASYVEFAEGFMLTAAGMGKAVQSYMGETGSADDPDASPLRAADLLNMPRTFLATAEFDPLRNEGRAYAARLIEAGTDLTFVEYPGAIHGIWLMKSVSPLAERVVADAADWARTCIAQPGPSSAS